MTLKDKLIAQDRWSEPPKDVPEKVWASAIQGGYTHRFLPLPKTELSYKQIKREIYGEE